MRASYYFCRVLLLLLGGRGGRLLSVGPSPPCYQTCSFELPFSNQYVLCPLSCIKTLCLPSIGVGLSPSLAALSGLQPALSGPQLMASMTSPGGLNPASHLMPSLSGGLPTLSQTVSSTAPSSLDYTSSSALAITAGPSTSGGISASASAALNALTPLALQALTPNHTHTCN